MNIVRLIKCPICGNNYIEGKGSTSRFDNIEICGDCGTRESLKAINVPEAEWQPILDIIHTRSNRR